MDILAVFAVVLVTISLFYHIIATEKRNIVEKKRYSDLRTLAGYKLRQGK